MKIIDGKKISKIIKEEIKNEVDKNIDIKTSIYK